MIHMKLQGEIQLSRHPDKASFRISTTSGEEVLAVHRSDLEFDEENLSPMPAWGIEIKIGEIELAILTPTGLGRLACQLVDETPDGAKVAIPTAVESTGVATRFVDRSHLQPE